MKDPKMKPLSNSKWLPWIQAIDEACCEIHEYNKKWWVDLHTGQPLQRNVGEMLMLIVSELAEGMEGHRKNLMDDKLPQHKMLDVELADAVIRIFDLAAGHSIPLGQIIFEKCMFNLDRADHKRENRLGVGGKAY